MRKVLSVLLAAALAGCATFGGGEDAPTGTPSLVIALGQPAPPQARFYADCIVQSVNTVGYDRESNVIRFHCNGDVARRFFDGLEAWSADGGLQIVDGDTVWRFTTPIRENPSFVDFCTRAGPQYECTVVLNVGEFLEQ
jgi:hypothetical protein